MIKTYRGTIVRFSSFGGVYNLILLKNIYASDEEFIRDHIWVKEPDGFNRKLQGKTITFIGKEYTYSNSIGKKQTGISFKKVLTVINKKRRK